jgi:hypothetical protein
MAIPTFVFLAQWVPASSPPSRLPATLDRAMPAILLEIEAPARARFPARPVQGLLFQHQESVETLVLVAQKAEMLRLQPSFSKHQSLRLVMRYLFLIPQCMSFRIFP